ncbi:hypothetical protein [Sporosarcina sp. ITBMC105]
MGEKEVFRVIKVVDAYHLVINGGSSHGLSEGDEVEVFVKGPQLTDPFNNDEPLGTLDYIKEILTIENVYPKFSICVNEIREKVERPSSVMLASFGAFAPRTEYKYSHARLNVKEEDITGGFPEHDKKILIGDTVRLHRI